MVKLFYSELNFFCILINMILFLRILKNVDKQNAQRMLEALMVSVMAFCAADMLWILSDHAVPVKWVAINYVIDIVYYILTGVVAYLWFLYSETLQESVLVTVKKNRLLGALPVTLFNILVLTTPWTHLMFYVDEQGNYHRGPLLFLQQMIVFGYLLFTSVKAFINSQKKKNFANKNKYLTISSFCVYPLVCGIWQMHISDTPVLSMGITLAILQVYINLQNQLISIDPLTQLNNRNQLIRFLSGKMKNSTPNKILYLLIMDMDYFKKINDQYGHVEGDRALTIVSSALKKVCANHNAFVCRYGGDEFIIVSEMKDEDSVMKLCAELNTQLAEEAVISNVPYKLHLSIGYAARSNDIQTIPDFIAEADKMLYEAKHTRG